jgi:hypothetical protein
MGYPMGVVRLSSQKDRPKTEILNSRDSRFNRPAIVNSKKPASMNFALQAQISPQIYVGIQTPIQENKTEGRGTSGANRAIGCNPTICITLHSLEEAVRFYSMGYIPTAQFEEMAMALKPAKEGKEMEASGRSPQGKPRHPVRHRSLLRHAHYRPASQNPPSEDRIPPPVIHMAALPVHQHEPLRYIRTPLYRA